MKTACFVTLVGLAVMLAGIAGSHAKLSGIAVVGGAVMVIVGAFVFAKLYFNRKRGQTIGRQLSAK